jgi:hypothetical protein
VIGKRPAKNSKLETRCTLLKVCMKATDDGLARCRLSITMPEIVEMQVRAIFEAVPM